MAVDAGIGEVFDGRGDTRPRREPIAHSRINAPVIRQFERLIEVAAAATDIVDRGAERDAVVEIVSTVRRERLTRDIARRRSSRSRAPDPQDCGWNWKTRSS